MMAKYSLKEFTVPVEESKNGVSCNVAAGFGPASAHIDLGSPTPFGSD
jgi:hypothetical protein